MVARIKKNDTVVVLSGKDKNKQGAVIEVLPQQGKVKVKDVAVVTRHVKARRAGEASGIKKEESFIDVAKVMPVCAACKKACRVNMQELDNGKRTRVCNRCKAAF